jgi:hypothetical protein
MVRASPRRPVVLLVRGDNPEVSVRRRTGRGEVRRGLDGSAVHAVPGTWPELVIGSPNAP